MYLSEEFDMVKGTAPLSVPVAVAHAAESNALKHKEFNDKWGRFVRLIHYGKCFSVIHTIFPSKMFIIMFIGEKGPADKRPFGEREWSLLSDNLFGWFLLETALFRKSTPADSQSAIQQTKLLHCRNLGGFGCLWHGNDLPVSNRRHGRLPVCATASWTPALKYDLFYRATKLSALQY